MMSLINSICSAIFANKGDSSNQVPQVRIKQNVRIAQLSGMDVHSVVTTESAAESVTRLICMSLVTGKSRAEDVTSGWQTASSV